MFVPERRYDCLSVTPARGIIGRAMATSDRSARLPSGRHGLPREFVVRNQQMRIIDAMAKTTVRKGYAATSVADIIAEAGVSRRTFYEHYRSKLDCFLTAVDAVVGGIIARVEAEYYKPGKWSDRFRDGLATLLDIMRREPEFARLTLVESLSAGPEARRAYQRTLDRFAGFFDEAAAASPFADDLPDGLPDIIVSGLVGVLYRAIVAGRTDQLPELLPRFVYFAEAPYVGPEVAAESARRARAQAASLRDSPRF